MNQRHIVAGSGGFIMDFPRLRIGPIVRYAIALSGKERPRVCLLPTAKGDDYSYIAKFYDACSNENIEASHLELFTMPNHENIEKYLLSQDVIWVAGGSVANLLAVWRVHGIDKILEKAWNQGIILAGASAGSICWHIGGTTDSFGKDLKPIDNALGFLPYSSGVHYDSESRRRPLYQQLIKDEVIPEGYATDDGVSIHFVGTDVHKIISDRPDKYAYHVFKGPDGVVHEMSLEPEQLQVSRK